MRADPLRPPGPARGPDLVLAGAGRGYASLHRRPSKLVHALPADRAIHPALRWLAWDGYGFQRAFFAADQTIGAQRTPRRLTGEQSLLFDQGVGRALWYHECADPDGTALRIAEFDPSRRPALWSGVGLAATYTGGADVADLPVSPADLLALLWTCLGVETTTELKDRQDRPFTLCTGRVPPGLLA